MSKSPKPSSSKRKPQQNLPIPTAVRGAFIDANGVRWDTNHPTFEGYLSKKSRWIGEWRKRYFILKGSKLFFSKSPTAVPHGVIDIADCVAVKSAESSSRRRNAFEIILKKEHFLLLATNEVEKEEWVAQIGRALVRNSGMFIDDDDDEPGFLTDDEE